MNASCPGAGAACIFFVSSTRRNKFLGAYTKLTSGKLVYLSRTGTATLSVPVGRNSKPRCVRRKRSLNLLLVNSHTHNSSSSPARVRSLDRHSQLAPYPAKLGANGLRYYCLSPRPRNPNGKFRHQALVNDVSTIECIIIQRGG